MRAVGVDTEFTADAWRTLAPAPVIYYGAVSLRPSATSETFASSFATVCDCWQTLDLSAFGFVAHDGEAWFVREPGPLPERSVPGFEIERVTTAAVVATFEAVSIRGFGGESLEIEPGRIHPASILDEPRMTMWLGRSEGEPVAAAMSYQHEAVVGIFGVATIEAARGRGYGTALTARAVLGETGLPAVLQTNSPVAARIYERLGFRRVGPLRQWRPGPVTRKVPEGVRT
jgi:ribosomal protein S18 acetylase RimI-like enzyme